MYRFVLAAVVLFASAASAQDLKYQFKDAKEVHYRFNLQGQLPDRVDAFDGSLSLGIRAIDPKGNIELSYAWLSPPKQQAKTGNPLAPSVTGGATIITPDNKTQFTIDPFGQLTNTTVTDPNSQMPFMMGFAGQLLLPELSPKGQAEWKTERKITIYSEHEEQGGPPRGPFAPRNKTRVEKPATETITYKIADINGPLVTIRRTYLVETVSKVGNDPETRQKMEGDYVFDTAKGLVQSMSARGSIESNGQNVSMRVPVAVAARLMTDDEIAKGKDARAAEIHRVNLSNMARGGAATQGVDNPLAGMTKSEAVGKAEGGVEYNTTDHKRRPLIGFRFQEVRMGKQKVFTKFAPLFEKPEEGAVPKNETVVLAKDGYAVGGLKVHAREHVFAFIITFMKTTDTGLDLKTAYDSPLYGDAQNTERKVLSGNGKTVYGIWGRRGGLLDSIGIIIDGPTKAEK